MMTYSLIEQDTATEVFLKQLENIRSNPGTMVVVAPLTITTFTIGFQDGNILLSITELEDEPDSPSWMDSTFTAGTFAISCDTAQYQSEILYLVMHIWRRMKLDSAGDISEILLSSFRFLKERWSTENEPKSLEEQKGLIGELMALLWVYDEHGEEFLRYWDASGHAPNDIETPEFHVEAKSKMKKANTVKVSFKKQLSIPEDKKLFLAVTDANVSQKAEAKTLPEIKEELLQQLKDMGCGKVTEVKNAIESWGLSDVIGEKFSTTFLVGDTTIYEVLAEHSCAVYGEMDLPLGIKTESYDLELSSFY